MNCSRRFLRAFFSAGLSFLLRFPIQLRLESQPLELRTDGSGMKVGVFLIQAIWLKSFILGKAPRYRRGWQMPPRHHRFVKRLITSQAV